MQPKLPTLKFTESAFPGVDALAQRHYWTAVIEGFSPIGPIGVADSTVDAIAIANEEYDYALPYIFARTAGNVVVWFANPKFPELPPFDKVPLLAFDVLEYSRAFPEADRLASPPNISTSELSPLATLALCHVPHYSIAEYCVPMPYCDDESGRRLLRRFRDVLASPNIACPDHAICDAFNDGCTEYEVGIANGSSLTFNVVWNEGIEWFRLASPTVFPVWVGDNPADKERVGGSPSGKRNKRSSRRSQ